MGETGIIFTREANESYEADRMLEETGLYDDVVVSSRARPLRHRSMIKVYQERESETGVPMRTQGEANRLLASKAPKPLANRSTALFTSCSVLLSFVD